jgi:hypothetical protein
MHKCGLIVGPPHGAREEEAADVGASKSELGDACLEAHRTLMEINPANEARFKDVAQFLAEDIRKS